MPVFLSTIAWTGRPHPNLEDIHVALDSRAAQLAAAGLRSVIFLPEAPAPSGRIGYAAAIVSNGAGGPSTINRVVSELFGNSLQRIETIEIDGHRPERGAASSTASRRVLSSVPIGR
jgi:hypothetical protein